MLFWIFILDYVLCSFMLERLAMQVQQSDIMSFSYADLCFYELARRTSPLRGGYCHKPESRTLRYIPK